MYKFAWFIESEDFEHWQKDHPKAVIHQVAPLVRGIQVEVVGENTNATSNIGVLVVYEVGKRNENPNQV